jgi:hypothetical protein
MRHSHLFIDSRERLSASCCSALNRRAGKYASRPKKNQTNSHSEGGQKLLHVVISNITCEVGDALFALYKKYPMALFLMTEAWRLRSP